jgi:hypothetical protein
MLLTAIPTQASRNDLLIEFHVFLALPLTWTTWNLLLFTASLVSFIWSYPDELTTPPAGGSDVESILETWRFWWIALPTVLFVVGLWNFWLLWMVFTQLSRFEIHAPTVQAPDSTTEDVALEHTRPYVL